MHKLFLLFSITFSGPTKALTLDFTLTNGEMDTEERRSKSKSKFLSFNATTSGFSCMNY